MIPYNLNFIIAVKRSTVKFSCNYFVSLCVLVLFACHYNILVGLKLHVFPHFWFALNLNNKCMFPLIFLRSLMRAATVQAMSLTPWSLALWGAG